MMLDACGAEFEGDFALQEVRKPGRIAVSGGGIICETDKSFPHPYCSRARRNKPEAELLVNTLIRLRHYYIVQQQDANKNKHPFGHSRSMKQSACRVKPPPAPSLVRRGINANLAQ